MEQQLVGAKRFELTRTFACRIANAEEVVKVLPVYELSMVELIGYMCSLANYSADTAEMPVYVIMIDQSDAEDGYVVAPKFYFTHELEGEKTVYGPITWEWVDGGDLYHKVSLRKDNKYVAPDPLPGFTAFERVFLNG